MADNDTQISVVSASRDGKWVLILADNEIYIKASAEKRKKDEMAW